MKYYILGSTRGLGKFLKEKFTCDAFDRPICLDKDFDKVVSQIEDNSLVIVNAFANGSQFSYVEELKDRCKIVVCGSIAAVNHDPSMPEYSIIKQNLEDRVLQLSLDKRYSILYLRLTSSSYINYQMIYNSIIFWLENPEVNFIGYNINE